MNTSGNKASQRNDSLQMQDVQEEFGRYEGLGAPRYKGFTTQSFYLTMRDGVKIAVDLVLPKNLSPEEKIPAIMVQTRYWRAVEIRAPFKWFRKPAEFLRFFTSYGYALVLVDVRGSGASFGTRLYPWSREEIMDGGEIVDWIVSQPWSNGKVGAIGTSYVGATAEFLAVTNHPAVKAVIPRFSQFDIYTDIAFPGGVFNEWMVKEWTCNNRFLDENNVRGTLAHMNHLLKEAEEWLAGAQLPKGFRPLKLPSLRKACLMVKGVKPVDSDKNRRLLQEAIKEHFGNTNIYKLARGYAYRDDIRKIGDTEASIDVFSIHAFKKEIERSNVAIFAWGSWLDGATADSVIRRFLTFSNPQRAVIGPWNHGGGRHASPYVPPDTPAVPSLTGQMLECLRFFDYHLKNIDNKVPHKVLIYYTMGEEKWKTTKVWPPVGSTTQRWYLAADNALSRNAPKTKSGADEYTVDFEATTGKTNRWHTQMGSFATVYPNRAEEDRRLLTYTSPPLKEDTEITGYPVVTLYVTSTATDGAFFVYLEDVDENGRVTYITEGQLRIIHRKVSRETPPYKLLVPYHSFKRKDAMPLVPGKIAKLTFGLLPTSVLIRKGHSIRVAIAGHDKDTFTRIPAEGTPVITVARNKRYASFIDIPVVQREI